VKDPQPAGWGICEIAAAALVGWRKAIPNLPGWGLTVSGKGWVVMILPHEALSCLASIGKTSRTHFSRSGYGIRQTEFLVRLKRFVESRARLPRGDPRVYCGMSL